MATLQALQRRCGQTNASYGRCALPTPARRAVVARSAPEQRVEMVEPQAAQPPPAHPPSSQSESAADIVAAAAAAKKRKRQAESTDAVATFLTRRFGLAGGLAWLGFLAVGTLGEQVKTRLEVAAEANGTRDVEDAPEVELPNGLRYRDLRLGGGQSPSKGLLVVVDYTATADGVQFESTRERRKPIVFLFGSRPFTGGMCEGLEQALAGMRAGGRRLVTVPPELGFGPRGAVLRPTEHVPEKQGVVPPGATLVYDVELVRVSIPPS